MFETVPLSNSDYRLNAVARTICDWHIDAELAETLQLSMLPSVAPMIKFNYGPALRATDSPIPAQYGHFVFGVQSQLFRVRPGGEVRAVSVRLRPEAARRLFRQPLTQPLELTDLFPASALASLEDQLNGAPDAPARALRVARFLDAYVDVERDYTLEDVCAALLRRCPHASIATVAARLDISERHLSRRFRAAFGISPKGFARVARMSRAFATMNPAADFAGIASACGYTDQAHMINEFQALCGTTPKRLVSKYATSSRAAVNQQMRERGYSHYILE